ncbi:hypothetical protein Trydic_g11555 [Trypoxylus dichotomus]
MRNWTNCIPYTFFTLVIAFIAAAKGTVIGNNTGPSHNKAVFCYVATYADHRPGRGNFKLENVDATLCTHIIYAFVLLNESDDSIYPLARWPDLAVDEVDGRNNISKLKAHYPHLKVTIAIGGWQDGSIKYSRMAANATKRSRFVNNTVDFLKKHDFDGIDLDWSYPSKRGGGRQDKSNLVALIVDLREAFDIYNYTLTAALDPSKDTIDYGYNMTSLSKYLDYMLVWNYDFHGAGWSRHIGHNAPLYSNDLLSASYSINYLIRVGADPNKLVMGVPAFGRNFIAADVIDTSVKLPGLDLKYNHSFSGPFTQEDGFLGYNEICLEFRESPEQWKIFWDDYAKVPFAVNGEKFISYDDVKSIREKVKFANRKKLGGIMVWELDTDDFRGNCRQKVDGYYDYPLLRTINNELTRAAEDSDNFLDSEFDNRVAAVLENNSNFNVDDHPREGRPKTFGYAELEALLDEDPCQTQQELSSVLGVTRQAISKRLHALGMTRKQGTWILYDLKPRDI